VKGAFFVFKITRFNENGSANQKDLQNHFLNQFLSKNFLIAITS